jgi:hypothetical protein
MASQGRLNRQGGEASKRFFWRAWADFRFNTPTLQRNYFCAGTETNYAFTIAS